MSRYSTRYDSGSSYKSLDPGNLGSYRSSNLSGYGGLSHSSSRSDRWGTSSSYSSSPSTSSSSRLHGSYSSTRSSAVDSVPLPRSTSFGRSEVLSSSTPRDHVDKGSYSSSLSRTSSVPTSVEESRSGRYSSRSSALTSNHSLDTGRDADAERRLRLARRRRQREEAGGGSETGSDNSKEPSVERSSSLRRDSDPDSGAPGSGQLSRRWAGRRMRESSLTEESEGKESSPDMSDTSVRRTRSLRGASGSSEDSTPAAALAAASSVDSEDAAFQRSSEARRSRRQQRLEEAGRGFSGSQDEGTGKEAEGSSSASSASTRPWRRRLQEQGITTASQSQTDETQSTRRRSRDGEAALTESTLTSARRRSRDSEQEDGGRRRSQDMGQEGISRRRSLRGAGGEGSAEEASKLADAVASEVETRAERIARYKEERRKQLAHIASITSPAGSEDKETDALPSLFTAAKREKEGSPSDSGGHTASEAEESGGALTLSSRLRALRSGSEERVKEPVSAVRPDVPATKDADVATPRAQRDKAEAPSTIKDKTSSSAQSSQSSSITSRLRKSPSPASSQKPLTSSPESTVTSRPSPGSRESSPKKTSISSVSGDKPGRRTSDSSTDSRAGRKPSDSSVDSGVGRKPSDGSMETRKSKSPSPVPSRLMAPTKSSAAKEAVTAGRGSLSPRSTPSPRGSPAPSDRSSTSKPATGTTSSRGPPRIKQSLLPERGAKDTAAGKEESQEEQAGSKYMVRLPVSKGTEKASDRTATRESPQRTATAAAPRLSSSSFSAASSTRSTDRDSGFGSSRLSSSSFSSTRSTDREPADTRTAPTSKPPRLQRSAHVDVSSSSSREGSEEKQVPGTQVASSVKRTSSLPSRSTPSSAQLSRAPETSRPQAEERKLSSSFREKEQTPPRDLPLFQKYGVRRTPSKEEDETSKPNRKDTKSKTPREKTSSRSPSSSAGGGLDDILAKNAEFLSSDEETGAGQADKGKGERRQLRTGEEPKLRRSLRKRVLHRSGSSSSSRDSPARESKEKEKEAESDITVTLPTATTRNEPGSVIRASDVKEVPTSSDAKKSDVSTEETADVKEVPTSSDAKKSDVITEEKDDVKKGVLDALEGEERGSKEGSPESDGVFETAPSTPRVDSSQSRRRPEDKSDLRKSALNKADEGSSRQARDFGKDEGEKEVIDIRSRLTGGMGWQKQTSLPTEKRAKDFAELLQRFSSGSDAESDSGHRHGASPHTDSSLDSATPSPGRRASGESGQKGILKRTQSERISGSSRSQDRPLLDPQLAAILERRRQKEAEEEGSDSTPARSAAEEIKESVRAMKESHQGDVEHQEEEAMLCMSVSERISRMQNIAATTEERPVHKPLSGATTPKRTQSENTTPQKQLSPAKTDEEVSGTQLIDRLSTLWAKEEGCKQRRTKFQQRKRDDWRTRTQPVTLEEIQQADGLESVSSFRAEVRRKASQNIFDQLKNQDSSKAQRPLPSKDIEFPQHLTPEKRTGKKGRRGRLERHKTLPVTAEELNAIPEGEQMAQVQLRDTHDLWKRDSRTDSGILCGSDVESLGSDSLRNLSLDMDLSENDPSRLSVSSKASIFRQLDEKARVEREKEKCASGAKRYIDRKKRERSRTQPVTEDEVKTAASISDDSKKAPQVKIPQPEVVNRPKSPSGNGESEQQEEEEEEDQLTKLSLAEKVRLFSQKQKEEQEAAQSKPPTKSNAPVRRRPRKLQASRYQTQPVTPEELEKASKISPLAMSLVKPPEPELLKGLKLKDQQELMMMHAEATLSQCNSRAGSRPSSQPGSRRGSFTTPDTLQAGETDGDGKGQEKVTTTTTSTTTTTMTTTTTTSSRGRQTGSQNELTRTDSEPRGILKKTKSTESVPSDQLSSKTTSTPPPTTTIPTSSAKSVDSSVKDTTTTGVKDTTPTSVKDTTTVTSVKDTTSTSVKDTTSTSVNGSSSVKDATSVNGSASVKDTAVVKDSGVKSSEEDAEGDRASPVAELVLPVVEADVDVSPTTFFLTDEDIGGESTTDPATAEGGEGEEGEQDVTPRNKADSKRRSRFADRKAQAERYLTQPPPQFTPSEKSPPPKRKYESRHMTQPITSDEMKEAECATTPVSKVPGGSISERLNQLKTSGEENWKRKVVKDSDTPLSAVDVKLRDKKGLAAVRPTSISDRLSKLEVSAEQWKERVEETDAKHFTVANKLSKSSTTFVSESPLVAKIKASSKKDLTKLDGSSNASSPVSSPSTPTKEFLPKVPLPKEIIADPVAVKKAEESKSKAGEKKTADNGVDESEKPVRVEVPKLDEKEIEQFFSTKEITEISDKVEVDVDDFNNIFVEANEILQSVKKIRPNRRKKATSRNPLKTVSQFVEIQTEYTQVNTGAAEKQLRSMKTDALKRDAGLAVEALAALSSKENFSNVSLRKTEQSSLPPALALQQNPFSDLMLLHVKGRRNVQTRLVEPSGKSMNAGDCYLLVTPDKVIVWVGEYSNIIEKAKAAEIATFIQQKKNMGYKGTAGAQTVEQAKDHLGAGKQFWAALAGDKQCQACGPEQEDELFETAIVKTNMVYRLQDGALLPYQEYWGVTPRYEMLDKKEVLVFDYGTEMYVWQGTSVSLEKRKQSMALAKKLWDKGYDYTECAVNPMGPLRADDDDSIPLKADKRPDWAIFGKVNQNMETILFQEKFADWPDSSRLIGVKERKPTEEKAEIADITAFDAKKMIPVNDTPVTLKLDGAHVGRGKKWEEDMQGFIKSQEIVTLAVKVWHIMEFEHYSLPEASFGQFHTGDTYVVRWMYMITNAGLRSLKGAAARQSLTGRERCAYFFWQGHDSTINEKGASALMTVELDEERGPQVRVVQGKEPPCFLNLFEGGMVVHLGKREDPTTNTPGPWRMYCVRGDEAGEVCLLEIPLSIRNLRSRSSLVLLNIRTGVTYVWHGVKSPKHVRELAVAAVKTFREKRPLELDLHKDAHIVITEVEEGEEKSEIWSALDSRDRSLYHSLLRDPGRFDYTPRLFYMTSVSMMFEVTEQMNPARLPGVTTPFPFFQSDLYNAPQPALFLVDTGRSVYLWQGWWPVGTEDEENVHTGSATSRFNIDRRCAMETALQYAKELGQEAYLVLGGLEPLEFQNIFPFWEPRDDVCRLAQQEGKKEQGYQEPVAQVYGRLTQAYYSLEELQSRPLPEGVDPLRLEAYLNEEEFQEVLDMSREEFQQLPAWKQKQVKQQVGLY